MMSWSHENPDEDLEAGAISPRGWADTTAITSLLISLLLGIRKQQLSVMPARVTGNFTSRQDSGELRRRHHANSHRVLKKDLTQPPKTNGTLRNEFFC